MKHVYSLSIPLIVAALWLSGCGHKESNTEAETLKSVEVSTAEVEARSYRRAHPLPGTIHPVDQATIASRLMASVGTADISIGQEVARGEVLIVLSADEINAQVEQAQAALAQVQRNYARETALLEKGATTAETVRSLEDQLRIAEAQLAEATTMESYMEIRAPFDGVITAKEVREGDLATPGMPLLKIEGLGPRQVYVQVPDSLPKLEYGSAVSVEAQDAILEAVLAEWSPAADPASRTRLAKLNLAEKNSARSGQYVQVNWPTVETASLWMPDEALSPMGQMERVFVLKNGAVHLRLIKTGLKDSGFTQILSGLNAGELVVLTPAAHLRDGQPAKAIQ